MHLWTYFKFYSEACKKYEDNFVVCNCDEEESFGLLCENVCDPICDKGKCQMGTDGVLISVIIEACLCRFK